MLNALNVSLSGMNSSRVQIENIMNNIANENTAGYKKRVVNLSEAAQVDSRGYGRGVVIGDTNRITNFYLYDNLNSEQSKKQYNDGLAAMLNDIESIFKETDDNGLSSELNNLFQAIEDLRSDPNSKIYKNDVANHSAQFVQTIGELRESVQSRATVVKHTLEGHTKTINNIVKQIGAINKELGNTHRGRNDLMDKRDKLENDLAQYIDIKVTREPNYSLKIGDSIVVSHSANIRSIDLVTDKTTQIDFYDTGGKSWDDPDDNDKLEFSYNGGQKSITVTDGVNGVNDTNKLTKLADKINTEISNLVNAEVVNIDGVDRLKITSKTDGEDGMFRGKLILHDMQDTSDPDYPLITKEKYNFETNSELSTKGGNKTYLSIFGEETNIKKGKIKPMLENLSTNDKNNKFQKYLDGLDNLVQKLVENTKEYKLKNVDANNDGVIETEQYISLDIFSGANVASLKFNEANIQSLKQDDLDYMATIQYKETIKFDKSSQNEESFRRFYQSFLVGIASDTENIHFKQEVQDAVAISMETSYDKITKVDKDDEMLELMKLQSIYEANAKLITAVDGMLKTLLNMTR